jgi:ribosome-associated protein
VTDDVQVGERIVIPAAELTLVATRASGPGGQHVNTSDTRIQLRWNLRTTGALTEAERQLVENRLAARLTKAGELVLECDRHRSQRRNRTECLQRLAELLAAALRREEPRKTTEPPPAARRRRVTDKRRRGDVKRLRRGVDEDEE